jgi:tetratricopeptide (TPR) repeat protein
MPALSLAMITRNEAAALGHCLESVRSLVDEIVIVDTGSTDATVAIAESFGARIGHFPWRDDFAAARNESLRLCTGDWVLVLDADEAIDKADHGKIRAALEQGGAAAFHLVSRNYTWDWAAKVFDQPVLPNRTGYAEGAEFPFYADMPIFRLFRRMPGMGYAGRIHELLDPWFRGKNLPIGNLDAVIHHFGKLDESREKAKMAYYLELAERDTADHPRDADRQFKVMAQAEVAGQWEKALAAGLAVLRHSRRPVPFAVLITLARAYHELGRDPEALPHLQRVLQGQPDHPQALWRMAFSLVVLGREGEARPYLARAIAAHPEDQMPFLVLCDLEERAGRLAEARAALRSAIERHPQDPRLRQGLVDMDLRHRMQAQAAADAMEALRALPGQGGGQWHALAAGFLLGAGHRGPGQAVLDLGLAAFPLHEGLRALDAAANKAPEA